MSGYADRYQAPIQECGAKSGVACVNNNKKHLVCPTIVFCILSLCPWLSSDSRAANPPQAKTANKSKRALQQDWPVYGGQLAGDRYSHLTQINRHNVSQLKVAWTYNSGEKGGLQTSPLVVGRVVYAYTPTQKVIALDGASGKLLWTFDSGIKGTQPTRGLTWWADGNERRLLAGVMNFLYALDPQTGKPISTY
jgi:quinoprotein glucose dehydrogenase